jgi:hypothetical protein
VSLEAKVSVEYIPSVLQQSELTVHLYTPVDSSVGIATRLRAGRSGFLGSIPAGLGILLFTTTSRPALGPTQAPLKRVPAALSLGAKWPRREADRSPPSSAEANNALSYTSTHKIHLQGVVLSLKKHRDNFTSLPLFTFTSEYGLDDRVSRVRFPAGARNFSLHHRV